MFQDKKEGSVKDKNKKDHFFTKKDIKLILVIALILFVLYILLSIVGKRPAYEYFFDIFRDEEGKIENVITDTDLMEIREVSDLYTYRYPYSGVVTVYKGKKKKKVAYYIAYSGTITAGINMKNVHYKNDPENKEITIIVPQAEIQNCYVNVVTMDYIFLDRSYDTEKQIADAQKYCQEDLLEKAKENEMIKEKARKNAEKALEGLYQPLTDCRGYTLTIKEVQ